MFYHTPKTKGETILSVKKKFVKPQRTYRFRLELDIENGLHFHSGIGKAAKTHHRILPLAKLGRHVNAGHVELILNGLIEQMKACHKEIICIK